MNMEFVRTQPFIHRRRRHRSLCTFYFPFLCKPSYSDYSWTLWDGVLWFTQLNFSSQIIREVMRNTNAPSTSTRGPNEDTGCKQPADVRHASATYVGDFQEPFSEAEDE